MTTAFQADAFQAETLAFQIDAPVAVVAEAALRGPLRKQNTKDKKRGYGLRPFAPPDEDIIVPYDGEPPTNIPQPVVTEPIRATDRAAIRRTFDGLDRALSAQFAAREAELARAAKIETEKRKRKARALALLMLMD